MTTLFITATGTDVGKTHVACALIRSARAAAQPVEAFKPVLSGYDGPAGSDAARLLEALGRPVTDIDTMSPLRFAAPLAPPSAARQEARWLDLADLAALCLARMTTDALLLIEGAGGIMSPLAEGATNLDLADNLRAPVVLVTGSYLGAVSHTLTAIEVIRARGLTIAAIVISESEGDVPDLSEITGALAEFAPDLPLAVCPRGPDWDAKGLLSLLAL